VILCGSNNAVCMMQMFARGGEVLQLVRTGKVQTSDVDDWALWFNLQRLKCLCGR
jgi:hypothetical protein